MAAANLGWTFDEVLDQMTFEMWSAVNDEWRIRPPAHWLVAAYLGHKPPKPKSPSARLAQFA